MKTRIYKTYSDFLDRTERLENGVSEDFAKEYPDFEKQNETNEACWNCSRCSDCSNIAWLTGKKNMSPEPPKENETPGFPDVPVIENIHQKVFEAASKPDGLDMGHWHTCNTTHCRAGWVVFLAGPEGKKLEEKTSTLFAAMQILKASSPIRVFPPRFFEKNETALADMERCAKEEANS